MLLIGCLPKVPSSLVLNAIEDAKAASGAVPRPTRRALGTTLPRSAAPWVAPGDVAARSPQRASTDAPQVTGPTTLLAATLPVAEATILAAPFFSVYPALASLKWRVLCER